LRHCAVCVDCALAYARCSGSTVYFGKINWWWRWWWYANDDE